MFSTSVLHIGSGWRTARIAPNPARRCSAAREHVEVDLDLVDLLHAADVGVAEGLVGVDERAALLEAGARVDHLVAVDLAAAALELVLRDAAAASGRRRAFRARIPLSARCAAMFKA